MNASETADAVLQAALRSIQLSVRSERPYVVGGDPDLPVKLNQNESPFDLPQEMKRELLNRWQRVPLNRYPREHPDRLARVLAKQHAVPEAAVLVGNGSNELSYLLGLCVIRKGTPVVLPRPMFSLYEKVARLYDASLVQVGPRDDFSFDADALVVAVRSHRPALTVIATPNNPTGMAMRYEELRAVVAAAPGIVVVDEAYAEFNSEPSATGLLTEHTNLLVMRTFSKAMGLAGLRLGYLLGRSELVHELRKARLPFVVDPLAEEAAMLLLEHPEVLRRRVDELSASRAYLQQILAALPGVQVVPSQANFVIFRAPVEPAELMTRLADAGILIRDMGGYPELRGFVRVNAGTPSENRTFLAALKNALRA